MTSDWQAILPTSNCWSIEMAKVAVFPVPDWACAITSRPEEEEEVDKEPLHHHYGTHLQCKVQWLAAVWLTASQS